MHSVLRLFAKGAPLATAAPRTFPRCPTITQTLLTPRRPNVPTILPHLEQQVGRFTCGTCLLGRDRDKGEGKQCSSVKGKGKGGSKGGRQCSSVKGKGDKGKEKGSQCSEVKGKKGKGKGKQCGEVKGKRGKSHKGGGQCSTIKGKENGKKGGQCSTVKGKRGGQCSTVKGKGGGQCSTIKGKQCGPVKGKRDKSKEKGGQCSEVKGKGKGKDANASSGDCSCSILDDAKDVAKASTVICEGDDIHHTSSSSSSSEECSSSSSSSSGECSEEEEKGKGKDKDDSSGEEEIPTKDCHDGDIDPEQDEKNSRAVLEMCSCIQKALEQTGGSKKDVRNQLPKETKTWASTCGSSQKKDPKPKVSEHVKCCQIETSKTAPLGSSNSCINPDKKPKSPKHEDTDDSEEDCGGDKPKSKNDPCQCIKKALKNCSQGITSAKPKGDTKSDKKSDKKTPKGESKKPDQKSEPKSCASSSKSESDETSDEDPPSKCGAQHHGKKTPPYCG